MDKHVSESIRMQASCWSLAGDRDLLQLLQSIHQNITERTQEANTSLEAMVDTLNNTSVSLQNVNNRFKALSNSQFIESRVYEDDADIATDVPNVKEPYSNDHQKTLQSDLVDLTAGLKTIEQFYEEVRILPDSDSDTGSDAEEEKESVVFKAKNLYANRPLPHIIGTENWKRKRHAGLAIEESDSESSVSKEIIQDQEEFSSSDEDRHTGKMSMDLPASRHRHESFTSEELLMTDDESSNMNKSKSQIQQTPAALAAEIAKRLGGEPPTSGDTTDEFITKRPSGRHMFSNSQTQHRITGTVFSDEPPPLDTKADVSDDDYDNENDDIFAEIHNSDAFAPSNKNKKSAYGGLFDDLMTKMEANTKIKNVDIDNDIFDDFATTTKKKVDNFNNTYEDNLFSNKTITQNVDKEPLFDDSEDVDIFIKNKSPQNKIDQAGKSQTFSKSETETIKKPAGAISLFGTHNDAETIGAAILKHHRHISSSSEDDKISDLIQKPTFPQRTNANIKEFLKSPKHNIQIIEEVEHKVENEKSIFKDDIFDDIDDLFTTNIPVTVPIKEHNKIIDINLFDDGDLFADIDKVKTAQKKETVKEKSKQNTKGDIFDDLLPAKENIKTSLFEKESNDFDELFQTGSKTVPSKQIVNIIEEKHITDPTDESKNNNSSMKIEQKVEKPKVQIKPTEIIKPEVARKPQVAVKTKIPPISKIESEVALYVETKEKFVESPKLTGAADVLKVTSVLKSDTSNKSIDYNHGMIIKDTVENKKQHDDVSNEKIVKNYKENHSLNDDIFDRNLVQNINENVLLTKNLFDEDLTKLETTGNIPNKPSNSFTDDLFSDVFDDQPPIFKRSVEPKKSKNVNALFDDDSDDEALFFKRNDNLSTDNTTDFSKVSSSIDLFQDEPPELSDDLFEKNVEGSVDDKINVDFKNNDVKTYNDIKLNENDDTDDFNNGNEQKTTTAYATEDLVHDVKYESPAVLLNTKESVQITQKNRIFNPAIIKSKSNDESDSSFQPKKVIGKLKSNLSINVNTLLPGASPKKIVNINKSQDESEIPQTAKSISFVENSDSSVLCNKISKDRAKIQIKRRPSSRRARKEAIRKSTVDYDDDDDTVDSNSLEYNQDNTDILKNNNETTINTLGKVYSDVLTRKDNIPDILDNIKKSKDDPENVNNNDESLKSNDGIDNFSFQQIDRFESFPVKSNGNADNFTNRQTSPKFTKDADEGEEKFVKSDNYDELFEYESNDNFFKDTKENMFVKINNDLFTNKKNEETSVKIDNDNISVKDEENTKEKRTNDDFKLFNDEADDAFFIKTNKPVVINKENINTKPLFDDDLSDDELFGAKNKKIVEKTNEKDVLSKTDEDLFSSTKYKKFEKPVSEAIKKKVSLFGDDDSDDNLFSSVPKTRDVVDVRSEIKTQKVETENKMEPTFKDPLSAWDD